MNFTAFSAVAAQINFLYTQAVTTLGIASIPFGLLLCDSNCRRT